MEAAFQRVEYTPPRFMLNNGASFIACVVMRDERTPEQPYYHLCAIEPLEAEDEDGNIVAVGPGEMFTATGMELDPFFGIGIKVEIKGPNYTVQLVEPQYEEIVDPGFPNVFPMERVLTNGH